MKNKDFMEGNEKVNFETRELWMVGLASIGALSIVLIVSNPFVANFFIN